MSAPSERVGPGHVFDPAANKAPPRISAPIVDKAETRPPDVTSGIAPQQRVRSFKSTKRDVASHLNRQTLYIQFSEV